MATVLVLASRNKKKIGEMRDLLSPYQIDVRSSADFPDVPEVVEDGTTFAENAAKKASQTAAIVGHWTIGEDSGLQVDALDGAPGVYSARYSGENATDESNNAKLMTALESVPPERRGAGYWCSVAVADSTGEIRLTMERTCRGRLTEAPRGSNGFGYDPYFLIPELHRTFGELGSAVKRHISHRARAFEQLLPSLVSLLNAEK